MDNLETLNDIFDRLRFEKYKCKKAEGYDFYKIQDTQRKSAIEHIKSIQKSLCVGKLLEYQAGKGAFSDIELKEIGQIEWIKMYFNITDKELKNNG